jgi:Lrp/AsnC family transcriptional regulator for asnA, asnC and gidA
MAARAHLDNAHHALLDDVAKQIIAQLQEDGRRPYASAYSGCSTRASCRSSR